MADAGPAPSGESALRPHTSVILRDLLDDLDAETVPLSLILAELRGRA